MKRALLIALIGLNVGLLAWVMNISLGKANAQAFRGSADYAAVTGKIGKDSSAIYVVDLTKRRMLAYRFDDTTKRMVPYKGTDLARDFKRDKER